MEIEGYKVIRGLVPEARQLERLRAEADYLCSALDADDYLERGCAVDWFRRRELPETHPGRFARAEYLKQRWPGNAPSWADDAHRAVVSDLLFGVLAHEAAAALAALSRVKGGGSGTEVLLFNEQYVVKPPDSEFVFRWHRDADEQFAMCYYGADDARPTYVSVWLALDDADAENGCLWMRPDATNALQARASSGIPGHVKKQRSANVAVSDGAGAAPSKKQKMSISDFSDSKEAENPDIAAGEVVAADLSNGCNAPGVANELARETLEATAGDAEIWSSGGSNNVQNKQQPEGSASGSDAPRIAKESVLENLEATAECVAAAAKRSGGVLNAQEQLEHPNAAAEDAEKPPGSSSWNNEQKKKQQQQQPEGGASDSDAPRIANEPALENLEATENRKSGCNSNNVQKEQLEHPEAAAEDAEKRPGCDSNNEQKEQQQLLEEEGGVCVPVKAGDAVIFHSELWHRSGPNTGPKPRRVLYVQYSAGVLTGGPSDRTPLSLAVVTSLRIG